MRSKLMNWMEEILLLAMMFGIIYLTIAYLAGDKVMPWWQ